MNDLLLRGVCSYATRLATVSHGYVVLIILGRSLTRRPLMLATKRLSPLAPTSVVRCQNLLVITWSRWIDFFFFTSAIKSRNMWNSIKNL